MMADPANYLGILVLRVYCLIEANLPASKDDTLAVQNNILKFRRFRHILSYHTAVSTKVVPPNLGIRHNADW